ncbi:DUF7882 family protein [Microbacterium hydrocarbonoxydans]|uniref:DUF7882 family protein n=1 Tax=Microbacterium hydrocarbonoxydans TaxID=273678 RepID=UPI0020402D13|nr:hypothetical protein [Microbacterium hydrocarbonoxydans]MCM3779716.1 hypothetical protein [Microbacterium hydrocarbonoxydans]
MGKLEYNSSRPAIEIDDDLLVHVKIVIATKLRRQESFMMTWPGGSQAAGAMSAWIHPAIPMVIEFDQTPAPKVDPRRIEQMMARLNARGELILDELE